MSTIYIMEAVNLFCGDDDPTQSKHLTISAMKLPVLEETYDDHTPAGSLIAIEVAMGVKKLSSTFKLKGYDPLTLSQFGLGQKGRRKFSAYGKLKDLRTERAIEVRTIMEGRLGKIEHDEFNRGQLQGADYMIGEIMHYESYFDGAEKYYWDFFTQDWRVDGLSQNADELNILRIPAN